MTASASLCCFPPGLVPLRLFQTNTLTEHIVEHMAADGCCQSWPRLEYDYRACLYFQLLVPVEILDYNFISSS